MNMLKECKMTERDTKNYWVGASVKVTRRQTDEVVDCMDWSREGKNEDRRQIAMDRGQWRA